MKGLNMREVPNLPVYMDYQSTTPTDPRVVDAMLPYFTVKFGNPHSRSHKFGWEAEAAVEVARENVANVIGANPKEIIFTSGATESNNLAIRGAARFYKTEHKNHIITLTTEHKCVLDVCRHLASEGFNVTYLPVQSNGIVDLDLLQSAISDKTILLSAMFVNNEIGVIQPIKEIGKICRERGVLFHSDLAQGFGKVPINMDECNIDLASISGHKIYGPKGIGALYIRKKPRVRLTPLFNGGGQERGMRSGTNPTPLVVGLGCAAKIASDEMRQELDRVSDLGKSFLSQVESKVEHVYLNGDKESRYWGNVNLSFSCVEGESMILGIKDLAVSSGSACTSSSLEPSYVLRSIGVSEELAHTSIRFGFGRFTTQAEVDYAADLLAEKVDFLRNMSPLWEMMQDGVDLSKINWSVH